MDVTMIRDVPYSIDNLSIGLDEEYMRSLQSGCVCVQLLFSRQVGDQLLKVRVINGDQ